MTDETVTVALALAALLTECYRANVTKPRALGCAAALIGGRPMRFEVSFQSLAVQLKR